jgi:hypothetical protein
MCASEITFGYLLCPVIRRSTEPRFWGFYHGFGHVFRWFGLFSVFLAWQIHSASVVDAVEQVLRQGFVSKKIWPRVRWLDLSCGNIDDFVIQLDSPPE